MAIVRIIDGERFTVTQSKEEIDAMANLGDVTIKLNMRASITEWKDGIQNTSTDIMPVTFLWSNIVMWF